MNIRNCEFGGGGIKVTDVQEAVRVGGEDRWVPRPVEGGVERSHWRPIKYFLWSMDNTDCVVFKWLRNGSSQFLTVKVSPTHQSRKVSSILNLAMSKIQVIGAFRKSFRFWQDVLNVAMKNTYVAVECHLGASPYQSVKYFPI